MANPGQDSITLGTANIATGTTVATGLMGFLNENAAAISVLIGFTSLLVALIFYILNYRLKLSAHRTYRDEILRDVVEQLQAEGIDPVGAAQLVKERRRG